MPGALPLLGLGMAASEWALAYAMEMPSSDLSMQVFWGKVQYFGIVSTSVSFFLFASTYAQYQKIAVIQRDLASMGISHPLPYPGMDERIPSFDLERDHPSRLR